MAEAVERAPSANEEIRVPASGWKLAREMSAAAQLIAALPDDERLRHDTIEGETEAFECLDGYGQRAIADAELVKLARERVRRLEERIERSRGIVVAILQALRLRRVERPLFTASLSQRTEVVEAPTNEALPESFVRRTPDKILIGKVLRAGQEVPGYRLQDKTDVTLLLRAG